MQPYTHTQERSDTAAVHKYTHTHVQITLYTDTAAAGAPDYWHARAAVFEQGDWLVHLSPECVCVS